MMPDTGRERVARTQAEEQFEVALDLMVFPDSIAEMWEAARDKWKARAEAAESRAQGLEGERDDARAERNLAEQARDNWRLAHDARQREYGNRASTAERLLAELVEIWDEYCEAIDLGVRVGSGTSQERDKYLEAVARARTHLRDRGEG